MARGLRAGCGLAAEHASRNAQFSHPAIASEEFQHCQQRLAAQCRFHSRQADETFSAGRSPLVIVGIHSSVRWLGAEAFRFSTKCR